jgi:hypothetical protein
MVMQRLLYAWTTPNPITQSRDNPPIIEETAIKPA